MSGLLGVPLTQREDFVTWQGGKGQAWFLSVCPLVLQWPPGHLFFRLHPNREAIQSSLPVSVSLPPASLSRWPTCHSSMEAE